MSDDLLMKLYEAKAIATEQQSLIEKLKNEKAFLEEKVKQLEEVVKARENPLLAMCETQAVAFEKQLEIDRLNRENKELIERLRAFELVKENETFLERRQSEEIPGPEEVWTAINDLDTGMDNLLVQIPTNIDRLHHDPATNILNETTLNRILPANTVTKQRNTILIMGGRKKDDLGVISGISSLLFSDVATMSSHNGMILLSEDRSNWIQLSLQLPYTSSDSGGVILNEEIYQFGGSGENSKAVYKLNKNLEWIRLADMNIGRWNITNSCLAWNGYIWVLGGLGEDGKPLKSVERYDPKKDTWTFMPNMKYGRSSAAATVWNERIIISGGEMYNGKTIVTNTVEYFNSEEDCWSELPNMPTYLVNHSLVTYKTKLVIMGGYDGIRTSDDVWKLNHLNPNAKWRQLISMKKGADSFTGIVLDEEVYVIGGWKSKDRVQIFDGKDWRNGSPLPYAASDMSAVIIPQYLADRLCHLCREE